MKNNDNSGNHEDQFDLNRFITAQAPVYGNVLTELRNGLKVSHWMWYIFPQIDGLGFSATTKYYSIKSREEARKYLGHPLLGKRLRECAEILCSIDGRSIEEILGYPDDLKLHSSMTLFAHISAPATDSVFTRVLNRFFGGKPDLKTLQIISGLKE